MRKFTFFNGFEKSWDGISIDTIREVAYQYMGRQNRNVFNLDYLSLYQEIHHYPPERNLRELYFGGIDPFLFTSTQVQR